MGCLGCSNPRCIFCFPPRQITTTSGLTRQVRRFEDEKPLTLNERIQDVFDIYAGEFDKIYENRTRGDFTAKGFLAEFLMDIDKVRAQHAD